MYLSFDLSRYRPRDHALMPDRSRTMPTMIRTSLIAAGAIALTLLSACETAPVTGRRQLVLLPESQATSPSALPCMA